MLNFGKDVVYNTFDQNRLFLGINYHISSAGSVQIGYMFSFQQASAGVYRDIHTARLNYLHNLDVRKREKRASEKALAK